MRKLSESDKQILEALYQRIRSLYLEERKLLTREDFATMGFPIVVSCYGLLALTNARELFELIPQKGSRRGPYQVRGHG
jgi:hypothetical protein